MLSSRSLSVLAVLALPALISACVPEETATTGNPGGSGGAGGSGGSGPSAGPTYHKDVAPILQKSCQTCHQPGEIAPFSLLTYQDAKTVSVLMAEQTAARTMPPWGAFETDECQPPHAYKDDVRLSAEEIATIEAWHAAGAPEGDPADAPPPYDPPPYELASPTVELTPVTPYVTSGDTDEFRCFVLDPNITETTYINGSFFVPQNRKVVHHILLFADETGESLSMMDADGGYDCFGGPGIAAGLVATWVPGSAPTELPANIGHEVKPGTVFVMQIHYHPAGDIADPDATTVQLRFSDSVPEYVASTRLIGNFKGPLAGGNGLLAGPNDPAGGPEFLIPADVTDHTETMLITLPDMIGGVPTPELYVYGLGAHMHLVGVDEKVTLEKAGQDPMCLLHEPRWDFNWQRGYAFDAPVTDLPRFEPGDKLRVRCTFDNTMENPALKAALKEQALPGPVDVGLGESTLEEMCLTGIQLVTPNK